MVYLKKLILNSKGVMRLSIASLFLFWTSVSNPALSNDRIVSVGGSVTEIIYALGEEDRLVARDSTSSYPAQVRALPDVGYMRRLAPEGVLSVEPDLIIAESGAGPQETIDVLEAAQVPFIIIPDGYSHAGVIAKINAVAQALSVPDKGRILAEKVDEQLKQVAASVAAHNGTKTRVMFILSTRGGKIMAAGTDTAANGIITMAGAQNVFDSYAGYKPVSDEAVSASAPDVILMMNSRGHGATDEELLSMPALRTTPAALNKRVIRMDGLFLLGFGPRTADAVSLLHDQIVTISQ